TTTTRDSLESTTALASTLSGDRVTLIAERDIAVKGSNVVASGDATLLAGQNITLEAATNTSAETHFREQKKSGVFSSGGIGITLGSRMNSSDRQSEATLAAKSTVGSLAGDITLLAGEKYRQVGSDVIAAKGDIAIAAKTVDIVEARETSRTTMEQKSKQSGLTLAITSPVISAIQTAQQMSQAAGDTSDPRMQALAAASTGLAAYNAANAVEQSGSATGGVNIGISLGSSKSSSTATQTSDTAAASTLAAGRDIKLTATGSPSPLAGEGRGEGDITLQGTNASAVRDIHLAAADEIKLLAARNTFEQHSTHQNSSASLGIGFMVGGTQSGFTIQAGASAGRGNADGQDQTHLTTKVGAGGTATLASGGDTALRGATVAAQRILAEAGGDLKIESLQDTSTYDSQQKSLGGSISVGYGKIGGSVSASSSKVKSDYASVTEQSGLRAGDGGFQVAVQGDTDLKGGAITSTQQAIDDKLNRFETGGSLTLADIRNHAAYDAKAASVSLGAGASFDGKLVPGGSGAGIGKDAGKAESMTQAAISGIAGNTQARTGDQETGIGRIFDAEKVQKEIAAQVVITQSFGQQAGKAVGDYVQAQKQTLREAHKNAPAAERAAIQARFDDLILQERVMNVLIGAVTGLSGSALAKETLALAGDEMHRISVENSMRTAGFVDAYGNVLTNLRPGEENKLRQDIDLAGTRLDPDGICGPGYERCKVHRDEDNNPILDANGKPLLAYNAEGRMQFTHK
ncbi:MAG: hemagglutinin repeat-containing protein, partial [Rhodocyclaceae bacterium]|nr:hemagglutinin repeat-containing protein [Rhodocyclaceae bacterium]